MKEMILLQERFHVVVDCLGNLEQARMNHQRRNDEVVVLVWMIMEGHLVRLGSSANLMQQLTPLDGLVVRIKAANRDPQRR